VDLTENFIYTESQKIALWHRDFLLSVNALQNVIFPLPCKKLFSVAYGDGRVTFWGKSTEGKVAPVPQGNFLGFRIDIFFSRSGTRQREKNVSSVDAPHPFREFKPSQGTVQNVSKESSILNAFKIFENAR